MHPGVGPGVAGVPSTGGQQHHHLGGPGPGHGASAANWPQTLERPLTGAAGPRTTREGSPEVR